MGIEKDITDVRFGKLVAIRKDENDTSEYAKWICRCDCGAIKSISKYKLLNGHTKSCGCLQIEELKNRRKHGRTGTRIYKCWVSMKARCLNPKDSEYKNYGGRGIRVCEEWEHSFEAFYDWAMANGYNDSLTIERIDCKGNYEPSNCTWADRMVQSNNRRVCRRFTYNGKTQNLKQWCNELNLNYKRVHQRIDRLHWTFEEAISR